MDMVLNHGQCTALSCATSRVSYHFPLHMKPTPKSATSPATAGIDDPSSKAHICSVMNLSSFVGKSLGLYKSKQPTLQPHHKNPNYQFPPIFRKKKREPQSRKASAEEVTRVDLPGETPQHGLVDCCCIEELTEEVDGEIKCSPSHFAQFWTSLSH